MLARLPGNPERDACVLADTANLRDLKPTSSFLLGLNRRSWPQPVGAHSIISNNDGRNSDDVVSITSQDLSEIPRYEFLRNARRWRQSFKRDGILHLRVHNEPTRSRSSPESSPTSTTSWASWPVVRARQGI